MAQDQRSRHDDDEVIAKFQLFLEEYHVIDIRRILLQEDTAQHYSLIVNTLELFDSDIQSAQSLLTQPNKMLPLFDSALTQAAVSLMQETETPTNMSFKPNIHVRLSNLPICPELKRSTIPKSSDMGRFLAVSGTVIRVSSIKMLEHEREFICSRCKYVFSAQADFEQFYTIPKPTSCPSGEGCTSNKFNCLSEPGSNPTSCRDYQEIKIQEQVQKLAVGTIPRSMWVVLEDDLVDSCKAGDDVTISGVVMRRWWPVIAEVKCDLEVVFKANHVSVNNEQRIGAIVTEEMKQEFDEFWSKHKDKPLSGRNHILASFCPQVYGLYAVKLAVTLILMGGVQRVDASGTRVRGESHMLLIGDPGTGKSQFLKYSAKIMPRSVLTTGIGSTSAGLTVAAVRDSGEWQLEAGALVLADGGLCCIDEFNSIREHDRGSIHEAMEQQTISVAKAGMVCKLNTRTTILAATNPKGQLDIDQSLSVNTALASPLLSRFDLVFVLQDVKNEDWDRIVSSFILEGKGVRMSAEKPAEALWGMDRLQAYICHAKTLEPQLNTDSNRVLRQYYQCQRQADTRNAARTTLRLLESLIRLAQAHARLMYREHVTVQDAVVAVTCVECSMQNTALLGCMNALHTRFPDDPEQEYKQQAKLILKRLGLTDLMDAVPTSPGRGEDTSAGLHDDGNHSECRGNDIDETSLHSDENTEMNSYGNGECGVNLNKSISSGETCDVTRVLDSAPRIDKACSYNKSRTAPNSTQDEVNIDDNKGKSCPQLSACDTRSRGSSHPSEHADNNGVCRMDDLVEKPVADPSCSAGLLRKVIEPVGINRSKNPSASEKKGGEKISARKLSPSTALLAKFAFRPKTSTQGECSRSHPLETPISNPSDYNNESPEAINKSFGTYAGDTEGVKLLSVSCSGDKGNPSDGLDLFKKPESSGATEVSKGVTSVSASGLFVTDDLSDEDLELEWPDMFKLTNRTDPTGAKRSCTEFLRSPVIKKCR